MKTNEIERCTIIVETLIEQGASTVFGYPGGQVIDIYDALYLAQDRIHHIITAHEQGAAHAADGYARATGKVGVVIATSGPGATNLVTGIATAYLDSVPLVAITGNVPNSLIGRDSFQEVDITGVTMHSVPGWVGDDHCITAEIEGVKAVVDICSSTSAIAGWSAVSLLRNLASPVCFY